MSAQQPMTRRERRELERRGMLAADASAPVSLESADADADADAPSAAPAATPAEPPRSRRERRQRERNAVRADDLRVEPLTPWAQPAAASEHTSSASSDAPASEAPWVPESRDVREPARESSPKVPQTAMLPVVSEQRDALPTLAVDSTGEHVLQWNPAPAAADLPRRTRATFHNPLEADPEPLPALRDTRVAPRPEAGSTDVDDYFNRLVADTDPSAPPTGRIVMPPELDLDRTDGIPRSSADAIARAERVRRELSTEGVPRDWFESLAVDEVAAGDDPDLDEPDDIAAQLGFAPAAARSAVSAGTATGFSAPEAPSAQAGDTYHPHLRSPASLRADAEAHDVLDVPPPSVPLGEGSPSAPHDHPVEDDRELSSAIRAAFIGFGLAVIATIGLIWGALHGWF